MESWKTISQKKIILPENLEARIKAIKDNGYTIATINGSFDLMHAGHLYIIYEASKVADILLVAMNTDDSIRRYKRKSGRPIVPLESRMQMMTAIGFVDYVTYFDEDDPCDLLEKIKPDVHVNGEEYGSDCLEAPLVRRNGGRIHIVPRIEGLSTSEIIGKIQTVCV
ncbi:MAG: rfaE bifunctional protein nucleotidyltransferase chain/domain [Chlamydiales bacterium]|jgi:rfaE bifunctional protein nucleotidyltransferase chain/domain